ncbi:hypothetical protein DXG03_001149 [Asterophora parasitica]|uniref:Uncharacterized protein n=1 Tax=Asterophora parasitica TaxID=117018 RepID=A0A9P7KFT3_9AGAR|nr:hypothetical protein DXG03_001149 [Asterophora parasitica]
MELLISQEYPQKRRRANGPDAYPLARSSDSVASKQLRGRKGRLARLPDLPLDVLFEIFGHLRPFDLLRLARCWKKMRAFLMSRNSRWVWRQALSCVEDLPSCPSSMSEPQFANLMFSAHCHHCGTESVPTIIWLTKNRACKRCFPHHFDQAKYLRNDAKFSTLPDECWGFAQVTGRVIHSSAFTPITSRDTRRHIVSIDLLETLAEEHAVVKGQPAELEGWLARTRHDHEAWAKTAEILVGWQNAQAQKRRLELVTAREGRLEAVIRNLNAAGWKDVLEKMDFDLLRRHELVRVPRDLTDGVWMKIKPKMIDFMERVGWRLREEHRLKQITRHRGLFSQYVADSCHAPGAVLAPPISELSQLEPFRSMIETSTVEILSKDHFPCPQFMFHLIGSWQKQRRYDLVQIMRKSSLVPWYVGTEQISLATSFFYCKGPGMREPIGQEDILVHPATFSWRPERDYCSPYLARLFEDFQEEFWNFGGDRVSFHEPAFLAARSIVNACGGDPEMTTATEMDRRSYLFECRSCQSTTGRLVMTWRRAVWFSRSSRIFDVDERRFKVIHAIDHLSLYAELSPPHWVVVQRTDPRYASAVAQIVAEIPFFRCHMCYIFGSAAFVSAHIKESDYLENLRAAEHSAELDLPSHVKLRSPPPDFWQIQQIYDEFEDIFFPTSPLDTLPLSVPLSWCTPKVQSLVDILLEYYSPDFQAIIFVEQRQTAICLAKILPAIEKLKTIVRCGALMGQGVNSDGIAKPTPANHKTAVDSFRKGDINIHDISHMDRYRVLQQAEPEINKVYQTRHEVADDPAEEENDDVEVSLADMAERERYIVKTSGAVLTYDNAIQLLHHICSLIPRDPFTPPHLPKFSGEFQVTLVIPSSIPLPTEDLLFVGPPRRSKKEAKRAAAFIAVKRLHELDVYDDYLLPIARSKGQAAHDPDGKPLIDVASVPVMMDVFVKDPWGTGPRLWLHIVNFDDHAAAALITGTMLPPADVFCGMSLVTIQAGKPMIFGDDDDEWCKRRLMLEFTRHGIWFRISARPFTLPPSLFLVPINQHHEPDYDAMVRLVASPHGSSDWSGITQQDFDSLMIMNTNEFGRPLLLRNIRHDLTPMSTPPPGSREHSATTYHQFFTTKWTRKKWKARVPMDGPLVEAAILPRSLDGMYAIDSEGACSADIGYTVLNGLVAPQDCCRWIAMSADVRRAFEVLPPLCRRITDIYRVRRARHGLGLPPIGDNLLVEALTLPSANVGYSNQRMETLGDAVLELCTTVHLFNKYPHRHEGQLSVLRANMISNRYLLGRAKDIGLEAYLISEHRSVHSWRYVEAVDKSFDVSARRCSLRRYPRRSLQDCMEALLGASFVAGGIPMALHAGTALGLSFGGSLPWSLRYSRSSVASPASSLFICLEESLGYTFHRSELLVEAMTHPSFSLSSGGASYQRLEFLGDALLDLVVLKYLYEKFPHATSAELALPKAKAICAPALASVGVRRLSLHKIMLVNRLDLTEAINAYIPLLETSSVQEIIERGWKYDPPKALSDVFESLMGAVLVDSAYNYDRAAAVVEHVMEDILLALSPSVSLDPVSMLVEWVAAAGCQRLSIEYVFFLMNLTKWSL